MSNDSNLRSDSGLPVENDIFEYLGENISRADIIKFRFLIFDLLPNEKSKPSEELLCDFDQSCSTTGFQFRHLITLTGKFAPNQARNLILEVLYLTKKYSLLKKLNSCRHRIEMKKTSWLISPLRRLMFKVCEELTQDDVYYLSNHFYPDIQPGFAIAEDLFQELYKKKRIFEKSVKELEAVFAIMERIDLKEILNDYQKETCFYDLSPTQPGLKCGTALIFNHLNFDKNPGNGITLNLEVRKGTNADKNKLIRLWEDFNFDVIACDDLTVHEMWSVLQDFAKNKRNCDYKCFSICILSHGTENCVYTSDRVEVPISQIHKLFGEQSNNLFGKPKLFFIQACQGNRFQFGARSASYEISSGLVTDSFPEAQDVALYADIFTGISSVPGFVSYRDEESGSVYIRILTDVFHEKGHREDLFSLMTVVNEKMSDEKIILGRNVPPYRQMCSINSQLRFKIIFQKRII